MPTGYTSKLMESGQSFQDFVMLCARAFGACVMMRDDSMDAPIPKRFKPSNYHLKELAKAKSKLSKLQAMSKDKKIAFGKSKKSASLANDRKRLAEGVRENKRLEEMESKVHEWNPPSADHVGLQSFMLEQIEISKNSMEYIEKSITDTQAKSPMDFYDEAVEEAERGIEYHTKEHDREVKSAKSRTKWIQQLRQSI